MHILIAEDDALSRMMLSKGIEKLGHRCTAAADGVEAWELYQREVPDVVISDWEMPGMDGLEFCARVRENQNSYTYFVLLTSNDGQADRVRGIRAGADDYLTKPLNVEELTLRLIVAERITALHQRLRQQQIELERLNANLYAEGRRDPLTGISNRLQLREDLRVAQGRAQRGLRRFSIALFDIDHFKNYNDTLGHLAGDEALKAVAEAFKRTCRQDDGVYRYGGEEFCGLFLGENSKGAHRAADRMRQRIESLQIPHPSNSAGPYVTVSGGVAVYEVDAEIAIDEIMRRADEALYAAKGHGRNRITCWDETLRSVAKSA